MFLFDYSLWLWIGPILETALLFLPVLNLDGQNWSFLNAPFAIKGSIGSILLMLVIILLIIYNLWKAFVIFKHPDAYRLQPLFIEGVLLIMAYMSTLYSSPDRSENALLLWWSPLGIVGVQLIVFVLYGFHANYIKNRKHKERRI